MFHCVYDGTLDMRSCNELSATPQRNTAGTLAQIKVLNGMLDFAVCRVITGKASVHPFSRWKV